ncbi:hypothetical protein K431DRAFT_68162 [Polychaeton citri CBS 116435]|uniref:Uncharacterized protein n=1 Tax=Polychaeton citri CBS 116435 TaxID=1314669 RepID=A0A9P4UPF8_9PEZI|nr:hypothetical protein K431DRAFT_68162 [Polychaeton citri CBS 116435]
MPAGRAAGDLLVLHTNSIQATYTMRPSLVETFGLNSGLPMDVVSVRNRRSRVCHCVHVSTAMQSFCTCDVITHRVKLRSSRRVPSSTSAAFPCHAMPGVVVLHRLSNPPPITPSSSCTLPLRPVPSQVYISLHRPQIDMIISPPEPV